MLITAGVHGDEYLPMLVVRELIDSFENDAELLQALRGRLTLIPVVNEPAFRRGHRCGDDGKDLARTCPGREDGSVTEQIAHELSAHIREADFYIDLHTGGTELCVTPLAGYVLHQDAAILDRQRAMAEAFQLPVVWGTSAELQGRSLSVARDAGVPAIYVEYLGAVSERREIQTGVTPAHPCVQGCLNVMRAVGALDGGVVRGVAQRIIEDTRPDSGHMQICHPAPVAGFLRPRVKLLDEVRVGEVMAEVEPLTGGEPMPVLCEQSGVVVVLRDYPRVNTGDSVGVIAETFQAS